MKSIFGFTKNAMSNLAQFLLLFLLLPILFFILSLIDGTTSGYTFVCDVIGTIDIFDSLMAAVSVFVQCGGFSSFSESNELYEAIFMQIENLDTSFYQMLIIAICVYILQGVWDILRKAPIPIVNGLPIFISVVGVFLGALINYACQDMPWFAAGFMLLLVFVVDMIYFDGLPTNLIDILIKYLGYCLKYVILFLSIIFITGFICVLLLIWKGEQISFGIGAVTLIIFLVPLVLTLLLKKYTLELSRV